MTHDYSAYQERPVHAEHAKLSDLVEQLQAAIEKTKSLQAQLKTAQAAEDDLSDRQIPILMGELGLASFTTSNGLSVSLKRETRTSIPKARESEAYAWLEAHDQAGLIKNKFIILFNRDQRAAVNKFSADLAKRKVKLNSNIEQKVEPQTLNKFVRDALAEGVDVPADLFGIYLQTVAVVDAPKKR